jgi:hypothetical protein
LTTEAAALPAPSRSDAGQVRLTDRDITIAATSIRE